MSDRKRLKLFEKIYNETYDATLKYIICRCSNLSDVDDIIQETYLELYRVLKEKRRILDKQAYIIAIAKNKIIKYFRINEKVKTISIFQEINNEEFTTIDIEADIDIETEFITKDNVENIWKYINSVNTDVAKIFYLYYILDMKFSDIAKELEMNESTIKSSLYRMLKKVKETFLGGDRIEK